MKKLNVAIIGQGRSGRDIHGDYFLREDNKYYNVKYVVDLCAERREIAKQLHAGCKVFADYTKLFDIDDIDLVVNATYSEMHAPITKDLILHGFNVLVEKPFGRTRYECDALIKLAKDKGVVLAVFQQTFLAPFYLFAKELAESGKLGRITQIKLRYCSFSRRWDWQTLQKRCAGNTYNTGPHPIGIALGLMDFDPNIRVAYSKLENVLSSGDADDTSKIILDAPGKPFADIEMAANDAYSPYNLKLQGTLGTFQCTPTKYKMTYIIPGENPEKCVQEDFIHDNFSPIYCREDLIKHEETGTFSGTAFDTGTASLYEDIYYNITEGRPMRVVPEMAAQVISVIETVHAQNPMPVKF